MIPRFRLLSIKLLFRRVVSFDRLGDDSASRVSLLEVLTLRRDRPCHITGR